MLKNPLNISDCNSRLHKIYQKLLLNHCFLDQIVVLDQLILEVEQYERPSKQSPSLYYIFLCIKWA